MLKKALAPESEHSSISKGVTGRGESAAFRRLFEQIEHEFPHADIALITTFPRGGLQLAQRKRGHDGLARGYLREFHAKDQLTWAAITAGTAVSIKHGSSQPAVDAGVTFQEFLQNNDLSHAIAAPLASPILPGYPGAVHVYRNGVDFSPAELKRLDDIAADADLGIAEQRAHRKPPCVPSIWLTPRPAARIFIFDGTLRTIGNDAEEPLDEHLTYAMTSLAQEARLDRERSPGHGARVLVPDQHNDLWPFRMVHRPDLPGLCNSDCVLFCLQPDCCDWSKLRPADLQADGELSRLVGALHFMQQEFHRSPTLDEIARAVHLSPFHFHRRFTELFGLTPKHVLLDCQIQRAKSELVAREKDLATVATECGFAHQSHFTSRFKQATGLTPTRWRRTALTAR